MKKKNSTEFSINFRLNRQRAKSGKGTLYLRLTLDKRRVEITTHIQLQEGFWNQKKQHVMEINSESDEVNGKLNMIRANVQKHYNRLIALDKVVTVDMLKNEYLGIGKKQKSLNELIEFYYSRFKEKVASGQKSKSSLKCVYTTKGKLKAFIKWHYKVSDFDLNEIKTSFVSNFEHFLTAKQKLSNNSAMKNIRILKRFTKFAFDQEWTNANLASQFKCSYDAPERDRLTMEEILILYSKELPVSRLSQVRDVFIFCCFTGYSYLDVYNLNRENIVTGIDGNKWIMKNREKTKTAERVPLLPIALEIIERYKSDYYCLSRNRLLPVSTNQCYNAYLKELATICEIKKHLTTHVARHSFATSVTLENDVPIETVSQMLGHRSIKTTQIYAKVSHRKVSNNMMALQEKLNSIQEDFAIPKEILKANNC